MPRQADPSRTLRAPPPPGVDVWECDVVETVFRDVPVRFFVSDASDLIQSYHSRGEFYELEELDLIAEYVKPGARILEAGCHVGNHTIFFEKFLNAASITVFDVNPETIKVFHMNRRLNELTRVNHLFLGLGLARETDRMTFAVPENNSGGTWLYKDPEGSVRIVPGDMVLAGQSFDFVKLDVEGLEIEALAGLEETLARSRPVIFVEVVTRNVDALMDWVEAHRYRVARTYNRYLANTNLLLLPQEATAEAA